jgi:branched-subunit amino acid ABC-type transport system permease component
VGPFFRRHRFLPLVTTIALSMVLDGFMLLLFGEQFQTILRAASPSAGLQGVSLNVAQLCLVASTLVLLCVLAWALHGTAFGRRIRAVVQHPHAALSLGIPAAMLYRLLFVLSGVLAAGAGIFIGIDQNLTPTLAFPLTIKAYAAVIAGGKGNVWGAVLCAYVIAMLEQLVVGVRWFGMFYVPPGYQATVALLFIIVFLLCKPEGLFASHARSA